MQKITASLTWGVLFGVVALFLISRVGFATKPQAPSPAATSKAPAPRAKTKASKKIAKAKAPNAKRLPTLLIGLYIFILAIFVGFELISKVPPLLHSPLMSGANAISGITIVGALFSARIGSLTSFAAILGLLAVIGAMINVVGGFLVTDRMIQMYLKRK